MNEAYSRLANAIIIQAVKDYQEAREKRKKLLDAEPAVYDEKRHTKWENHMIQVNATIDDVEHFFLSGLFSMLTDLDGEELLEKVKQMEVA